MIKMAISAAVHPVRVESTDGNQKAVKTVTIADPPLAHIAKRCIHQSNQHSLCPKCGNVSTTPPNQEKKSILIYKQQASEDIRKKQIETSLNKVGPRRHSDGITLGSTIKPMNKHKQLSKTTDNLHNSNENIKSKTFDSDTKRTTKTSKTQVQRSSSLKNPVKKTITMQSTFKNTNSRNYDKTQSGNVANSNRCVPSNINYSNSFFKIRILRHQRHIHNITKVNNMNANHYQFTLVSFI
jgi:hypothetical protein